MAGNVNVLGEMPQFLGMNKLANTFLRWDQNGVGGAHNILGASAAHAFEQSSSIDHVIVVKHGVWTTTTSGPENHLHSSQHFYSSAANCEDGDAGARNCTMPCPAGADTGAAKDIAALGSSETANSSSDVPASFSFLSSQPSGADAGSSLLSDPAPSDASPTYQDAPSSELPAAAGPDGGAAPHGSWPQVEAAALAGSAVVGVLVATVALSARALHSETTAPRPEGAVRGGRGTRP